MVRTSLPFFLASLFTTTVLLSAVAPAVAYADEDGIDVAEAAAPPGVVPRPEPREERWYGWKTITTDGIALTLGTVGVSVGLASMGSIAPCLDFDGNGCSNTGRRADEGGQAIAATLGVGAAATYLLGAPIIHATQGHWDKAGISLGLRALPIAFATPLLASGNDSAQDVGVVVLGVGALAAMAVDAAVVAREDVSPLPQEKPRVAVSPTVDAVNKGGGVSLVGTF